MLKTLREKLTLIYSREKLKKKIKHLTKKNPKSKERGLNMKPRKNKKKNNTSIKGEIEIILKFTKKN